MLPALAVLAGILDGGDSARLTSELVRGSQIATDAGAADSDPQTWKARADGSAKIAHPVVSSRAPGEPKTKLSEGQIDIVHDHEHALGLET